MKKVLPGLGLSVAVAIVAKGLAVFLPTLGAATLAILCGILLGNTVFRQSLWEKGTKFSESKLLEISVVLLGLTVTFQTIQTIGWRGVLFILLQMSLTILWTWWLGKKLNFSRTMTLLMAGGNAVCGSSAIASIAPVIGAEEEEKGQIITLVNLLGTVMMLLLPLIAVQVFGNVLAQSALIGGTLQSVGQVVASASMVNSQVLQYATLFKIMRIMLLVVVVLVFGRIQPAPAAATTKRRLLPWYVAGFLVCCVLNSFIQLPTIIDTSAHFISSWFETIALAAIGLRLDFRKFLKEGPKFLAFAGGVGLVQITAALLFISLLL